MQISFPNEQASRDNDQEKLPEMTWGGGTPTQKGTNSLSVDTG